METEMQVSFTLAAAETQLLINATFTGTDAYGGGANGWNKPDQFEYFALGGSQWHEPPRLPTGNQVLVSKWPSSTVEVRHLPGTDQYIWRYKGGRQSRREFIEAAAVLHPVILFCDSHAPRGMKWSESLLEYVARLGLKRAVERIVEKGGDDVSSHIVCVYRVQYPYELVELFSAWPKGQEMMLEGKEMNEIISVFEASFEEAGDLLVVYTYGVGDDFTYEETGFLKFSEAYQNIRERLPEFDFRLAEPA